MTSKVAQELIENIHEALETEEFPNLIELVEENKGFQKLSLSEKGLCTRLVNALHCEYLSADCNFFDGFLDKVEEFDDFEIDDDDKFIFDIDDNEKLQISELSVLRSAINLVKIAVYDSNNDFLKTLLNEWNYDNIEYCTALDALQSKSGKVIEVFRNLSRTNIDSDILKKIGLNKHKLVNNKDESFYCGGASFCVSNINVSCLDDLKENCSSCGQNQVICNDMNCLRRYYFFITHIDCSIDLWGSFGKSTKEFECLTFAVSELGNFGPNIFANRVPQIEGTLKIHNKVKDRKNRVLLGSSFLIDYDNVDIDDAEEMMEIIKSSSVSLSSPNILDDEYLVVSWRELSDLLDDTSFVVSLYRGESRKQIELLYS